MVEKDYFDAKFEGLEKLVLSQEKNLTGYIGGVSANVKEIRSDLQDHKESVDAHGLGAATRQGGNVVAWTGLIVAILTCVAIAAPLVLGEKSHGSEPPAVVR